MKLILQIATALLLFTLVMAIIGAVVFTAQLNPLALVLPAFVLGLVGVIAIAEVGGGK